jgi:membrane protease subunit HflC
MKKNALTIVTSALLVLIFALLLFVFQVRKSEVAVVTTFGRPVANITEPGAYFKWPWPIQNVYKFDQRVQNLEDQFSPTLTADNNMLFTSVYVGWKIDDAAAFYPKFPGGSVEAAQRMLDSILRSAKSAVITRHSLSEFVNADPKESKFDAIEAEIQRAVENELRTNNCGIEIDFLGIKKIGLPDNVTQSVFQRMTAERQLLINKLTYDGQAKATEIKSAADRQASETVNNAVATATRIRAEGEAEAAKTLPTLEKNPELANFLQRIDALKQSLNQRTTLILDERTPPFDVFRNLPSNPSIPPTP